MALAPAAASSSSYSSALDKLPDDILLLILRRLDGPSLSAMSSSSSHLHHLSSLPSLWLNICTSTYPSLLLLPSLPSSPRSFYSLAFASPSPSRSPAAGPPPYPVFSLVDLRHRGVPILSRVLSIDARSPLFSSSPFRLEVALDCNLPQDPGFSPADLELSWVISDQTGEHAVDLSSRKPVAVEMNWLSGDVRVRFASVANRCRSAVIAAVICGDDGVREVGLTVEDGDGLQMNGRDSMAVIGGMMNGERRGGEKGGGAEEARKRFQEFVRMKREKKEVRLKRKGTAEICWIASALSLLYFFFRGLAS